LTKKQKIYRNFIGRIRYSAAHLRRTSKGPSVISTSRKGSGS